LSGIGTSGGAGAWSRRRASAPPSESAAERTFAGAYLSSHSRRGSGQVQGESWWSCTAAQHRAVSRDGLERRSGGAGFKRKQTSWRREGNPPPRRSQGRRIEQIEQAKKDPASSRVKVPPSARRRLGEFEEGQHHARDAHGQDRNVGEEAVGVERKFPPQVS